MSPLIGDFPKNREKNKENPVASCDSTHQSSRPSDALDMQNPSLSKKNIETRERLIFALDVPSVEEAKALVELLGDSVIFYKLGLQIFMAGGITNSLNG